MTNPDRRWRLAATLAALAAGLTLFVAEGLRGHWSDGLTELVVLVVFGVAVTLLGTRSETAALIGGADDDERRAHIQQQSAAASGRILNLVILGGYVWTLSSDSGAAHVFGGLAAVSGTCFILSTAWYARSS